MYHEVSDGGAHPRTEVKKLSKQRESEADQAQIKKVSERVWKSLAEVRQRPRGRPKYSSYRGDEYTWETRSKQSALRILPP